MRRLALVVVLLASAAASAKAQETPAELLARARTLYDQLEVERAIPLLRQLLSPSAPLTVTAGQRAEGHTYLGAAFALTGQRDSAVLHFRNALQWDPFSDLDPARFTPAQASLFAEARRRVIAVGVRPVEPARLDPRTESVTFTLTTTHAAEVRVVIRPADSASARGRSVFAGENTGLRQVSWDLLGADQRLAPPARYALVVVATSRLLQRTDSARVYLDLKHEGEELQDTLPDLRPGDLLPERGSSGVGARSLLAGVGIAAGALMISEGLTSKDLGGGRAPGRLVAGVALGTGVMGFALQSRGRPLPGNVAENARRRADRVAANAAIQEQNAARIARTLIVITPAAGVEP